MRLKFWIIIILTLSSLAIGGFYLKFKNRENNPYPLNTLDIQASLKSYLLKNQYPTEYVFKIKRRPVTGYIEYTIDHELTRNVERLYSRYQPDYGAFVAIDPTSGEILALVSYERGVPDFANLSFLAIFPAASVFKIVTAAAAIDQKLMSSESIIPYNGANHTLYKRNVFQNEINKWTRFIPLKEAFAKSVNSVFGKIGTNYIGPESLREYAEKFGFNNILTENLPIDPSFIEIEESDKWGVAEAASGFTKDTRLSPIHGALIAATIANNGYMAEPHLIRSIKSADGKILYERQIRNIAKPIHDHTATELRKMMQETIISGTSQKSFREVFGRRPSQYIRETEIGGKTGSLNNNISPQGKTDWFVGYAKSTDSTLAIAAVTVHETNWRVKSSYLAGSVLQSFLKREQKRNKE